MMFRTAYTLISENNHPLTCKHDEFDCFLKSAVNSNYIFTITDKSPKKFRFTFTSKLQNMGLNIIQDLYYANMVYVRSGNDTERIEKRKEFQQEAYVELKLLSYMAMMVKEHMAVLPKQYE